MKATRSNNLALIFFAFVLLTLFFYITDSNSFAQKTKEKLQSDKKKLESDIAYTNKLLAETKKSKLISLNQIIILNNKINKREELITTINSEIIDVDGKITNNVKETTKLNKQLKQHKEEYAKMIVFAYKNRNAMTRMMYLFAAYDFNQAYVRLKYLQQYARYRKKQAELITETALELNNKIKELKTIKSGKSVLLKSEENEKTLLAKEKTEKNEAVKTLQKKEKELRNSIKAKQKKAEQLQQSIAAIIAEEIRLAAEKLKNSSSSGTVKGSETSQLLGLTEAELTLSNSFASNIGKLPWPAEKGIVTSTFGVHRHAVLAEIKVKNNGVDIATDKGTKARAVFDGKVTGVINIPGANKAVIVRHGEYLTVYSNLSEVYVSVGDKVKTKQNLGLIYTDADVSKTELHFELWFGKTLADPMSWLSHSK